MSFGVWDLDDDGSIWSTVLNEKHLQVLHILGVENYGIEVDEENSKILEFSKKHGAVETQRFPLIGRGGSRIFKL